MTRTHYMHVKCSSAFPLCKCNCRCVYENWNHIFTSPSDPSPLILSARLQNSFRRRHRIAVLSQITQLYVQPNSSLGFLTLCEEIHRSLVDSIHKRPVMRKVLYWHDGFISNESNSADKYTVFLFSLFWGSCYLHRLSLTQMRDTVRNDIHYKARGKMYYPLHCRSLEWDKSFHPTLYWECDHLSILCLNSTMLVNGSLVKHSRWRIKLRTIRTSHKKSRIIDILHDECEKDSYQIVSPLANY